MCWYDSITIVLCLYRRILCLVQSPRSSSLPFQIVFTNNKWSMLTYKIYNKGKLLKTLLSALNFFFLYLIKTTLFLNMFQSLEPYLFPTCSGVNLF